MATCSLSCRANPEFDRAPRSIPLFAGARDGRGHFAVKVTSERFTDLRPLQRHKLVYEAVGDLMDTDIHALSIETSTPNTDT